MELPVSMHQAAAGGMAYTVIYRGYDKTVTAYPAFYQLTYQVSDSRPASAVVESTVSVLMFSAFQKILHEQRPDAIISTYHLYNTALSSVLSLNRWHIPFFSVVTDLANVHHLWFQAGPDIYFVGASHVREEAISSRVAPQKIIVSGIPVDPRLANEARSKAAIRRCLGWQPDLATVLAVSSRRVDNLLAQLESIDQCGLPLQLAIVAGGNESLATRLKQKKKKWQIPVYLYDYVHNIPEMLHAADLLVTKAGGLITTEGLACGLPIILIGALPGQELGNVHYLCKTGAGVLVKSPAEMRQTLLKWFRNDCQVLQHFSARARQTGKPYAAYQVAEEVWRLIDR